MFELRGVGDAGFDLDRPAADHRRDHPGQGAGQTVGDVEGDVVRPRDAEMAAEKRLVGHLGERLHRPGFAFGYLRKRRRGAAHTAPRGRNMTELAHRL